MSAPDVIAHDWKYTGCDIHKGDYWYKCSRCGASDWIPSYGSLGWLELKDCNPNDAKEKRHEDGRTD